MMNSIAGAEELQVGAFHEIDHSKLSPDSPVQLKSVRIAMVSEIDKEEQQLVSVRYPSTRSLRTYFTNPNFGKPEGKKIPALDEKYVMPLDFAVKALYRRVPTQEFVERRNSWAFWASTEEKIIHNCANSVAAITCKQGRCWSQLKFTGMVQWGKRRHVRFLGRQEAQIGPTVAVEEGTNTNNNEKKRKRGEERVLSCVETRKLTRRQCGRYNSTANDVAQNQQSNKDTKKEQLATATNTKNKNRSRKISIDRWSAERYKMAEENMLKVMKENGAVYGNPILRAELRSEARKHIGDTGLLDHLLKHMAGKVAPGGVERFRRRHNAEGAMEYWLESADLVDVRRRAGVQDPYWTPPPGWTLGDTIIMPHDHVFSITQLNEIKQDILQLKQEMRELSSKKGEEALATTVSVTTPTSCLSSLNWEDHGSLVPNQEIYVELVNKKAKIEEQLKEISLTLSAMEEQLGMLKPTVVEEPTISESATPPALLPSLGDDALMMQEKVTAKDKAAKIERLKSGFQICKPKGTFMWPNMDHVSPQVDAPFDDQNVQPTPSSASSSTTSAPKPHTQRLPSTIAPTPSSHVKPLAEKRPLSTATLTHVIGPFSPHLSPPLETP